MGKRVLVVDGDSTIRNIILEVLEEEAYEVEAAMNGLDAFYHLWQQKSKYDDIVFDVMISGINGFRFLRRGQQLGFLCLY